MILSSIKNKNIYNQRFYDSLYDQKSIFEQEKKKNYVVLSKIGNNFFKRGRKVLDVGCGVGIFGSILIEKFKLKVYGLEISEAAIRKSRGMGIDTRFGNIDLKWPYRSRFFDIVSGNQIIEHIINPDHFLTEARRLLKKNGLLILSTPNLSAWFNRIIFLFGYHPFFSEASTVDKTVGLGFTRKITPNRKPLGHIRVLSVRAIRDLLDMHGFELISIKGMEVEYLPGFMRIFDKFFSLFASFASEIVLVAKKKGAHPML